MPRAYRLGKRANQKADTRARIVAAAVALYLDGGGRAATIKAIAARADVAPATVQNHFPGPNDLANAAADSILADLALPGPDIFVGLVTARDRMDRLAHALSDFYVRGESWWQVYERDEVLIAAWGDAWTRYEADLDRLFRAALGPLGDDDTAVAVVSAVIGPPVFFHLQRRGLSADETADVAVSLIGPWLEARRG